MVIRQLRRRLGTLDAAVMARIDSLRKNEIEQLGEALIDFTCQVDLDHWLQLHPE